MARLPIPGGDNGNWGAILNDYLAQSLKSDGTIKDNAVTNSMIAPNAVTATEIQNGSIQEAQLATAVQTKLNQTGGTWTSISGRDEGVKQATGGIIPLEKFSPDTNFGTALTAAINEADASGGTVVFQNAKTYTLSSALVFTDKNVRIDFNGAKLVRATSPTDFTPLSFVYSHSTPQNVVGITSSVALSQSWPMAMEGNVDRIEVASTAGWSVGDYAVVLGDDAIPGANPSRAAQRDADRVRIVKVDPTYLYTARPLRATLTTGIRIARMTQKDCVLKNLSVEDAPGWPNSRNDSFISISGAVKPSLSNFNFWNMATRACEIRGSVLGTVDGLHMFNGRTDGVIDAHGYGVILVSCCDFVVRNLSGEFTRHLVTTGARSNVSAGSSDMTYFGSNFGHRFVDGNAHDTGHSAFDFHEEASYCVIDSCFVGWNHKEPEGTTAAFQLRGRNNELTNSRSIGAGGLRANSFDGGGNFRVHNWTHTTIPGGGGSVGYGIYAIGDAAGTERCAIDISKSRIYMPNYLARPVYLSKAALTGEGMALTASTSNAGTNYLFSLNDSEIELDTVEIDIRGSAGQTFLFQLNDSTSSVRINRLVVRADGASWLVGTLTSNNGTLEIGELVYDTVPSSSLINSVGASGVATVNDIFYDQKRISEAYATRGNTDVTITAISTNFQHFTAALTNNRTVTEPGTPRRQYGWMVTYIRAASATGAFTITIGDDSLTQAGMWVRRMWSTSGWVTVAKGMIDGTTGNLVVANFAASAIVTESGAITANDNDTTIPTSAAVNDHVAKMLQFAAVTPKAYLANNYYPSVQPASSQSTSSTLTADRVRTLAFMVSTPFTVSALLAEFTVAGDANSVFHVGVWLDDGYGRPGALALDAGSISTGSGNAGTVATGGTPGAYDVPVSFTFQPGVLYHVGGAVQGVTTTQPTMRTMGGAVIHTGPLGVTTSGMATTTLGLGWFKDGYPGALSAISSPSRNQSSTTVAPRILLKAA